MKRYIEVKVRAVIDTDDKDKAYEIVKDTVEFGDWEVESWGYQDLGEVDE